jgi:hypothetical protein
MILALEILAFVIGILYAVHLLFGLVQIQPAEEMREPEIQPGYNEYGEPVMGFCSDLYIPQDEEYEEEVEDGKS